MGQKTHPYGFRLGVIKTWTSKWYEDKSYTKWLHEDIRIKRAVKDYLYNANIASVEVERAANKAKVIVFTARPGMVIGKGGKGIRIRCSGRLGGSEMSRVETYREGRVPLHTLRADIEFGTAEAKTTYGIIGVKVWMFKGEVLARKARRIT